MENIAFKGMFMLTLFGVVISTQYVPGTPGINWTEKQAEIIRNKLHYLWDNKIDIVKKFDFTSDDAVSSHTKYVYDPYRRLSTVDCDLKEMLCRVYWGEKRTTNIAFSEPKAIR